MVFKNKRYFQTQLLGLSTSSLKVHKKGLFDEIEYEISLENIQNTKIIQTEINNSLILTGVFFFAFSFLFLLGNSFHLIFIFAVLGFILILTGFVNRKKQVKILTYSDDPIIIYFKNHNKQEVINFAIKIIDTSNKYLLNKYGRVDRTLPTEPQIQRLEFLLDRRVITQEEFDALKNSLLGRDSMSSIGFAQ